MAKSPALAPLALPKIDLEEKSLEVRLRLKGKAALDVADYLRAYQAAHDHVVEAEPLILKIVHDHIEADRAFQTWRKANPAGAPTSARGSGSGEGATGRQGGGSGAGTP